MMRKVLYKCTRNSARSQMAEGILRNRYGSVYDVHSAGTEPTKVNSYSITVMNEIGIDISGQEAKNVSEMLGTMFDFIVTVCDNAIESCPIFPGSGK